MNLPHTDLSPELRFAIRDRRIKLLFIMYMICIFVFFTHNIVDIYNMDYKIIPIRIIMLLFILIAFFKLYKKNKYDKASYALLFILAVATITISIANNFDNFAPVFIIPFMLGAFSLFSWKKGLLFSFILLSILILIVFEYKNYFYNSAFLKNEISIFNFLFIIIIVITFAIYYETTRIEAYKMLLASNRKKDILYSEVHHRVKNNLNIVSSMLALQVETRSSEVKEIINISRERIDAIALVHNMLYISNDIEKINANHFIKKLCSNLQKTIHKDVNMVLKVKELELPLNEIIPLGLIINELFTNSLKHAFKTTLNPKIIIVLKLQKNNVILTYFDNGIGCNQKCKENIGLKLVNLNIKQLKGSLKITQKNGLLYKINYKKVKHV